MGISQNLGLIALLGLPFIIILYMLKPKHQNREVASTYLWQEVFDAIESASKIHKLRKSILLLLEILAILLITAMLSGLFLKNTGTSQHHILVLDGSISMQSEDVKPSRFEEAKRLADDYLHQLDDQVTVSVVVLDQTPKILFREADDLRLVREGIRQTEPGMHYADKTMAYETIKALAGDKDYDLLYFGDGDFQGAKVYRIAKDDRNLSVHDLVVTSYEESLSALTEVVNHGSLEEKIPISLYVDELYLTTKEVTVASKSTQPVFFDHIPKETQRLKVVVETSDILPIDNEAYGVVAHQAKSRVAYVSQGNLFLEKVLKLHKQLDIYQVDVSQVNDLSGYDLYLFDGLIPDVMPTDGNVFMIDPPQTSRLPFVGYIENPDFESKNHPITNLIEEPEFDIAVTQVFELNHQINERKDSIYETEHGTIAYSWENGRNRGVVFGFDFRYSDLPLGIEYPILMTNILNYLTDQSALSHHQLMIGDSLEIRLNPDADKVRVETPKGESFELSNTQEYITYGDMDQIGIYTLIQHIGGEDKSERFAVNTPEKEDSNIETLNKEGVEENYYTGKDLKLWLGLALMVTLLVEWVIYSRRKSYAH